MTKFEQKGVSMQYSATSKEHALALFSSSCNACICKGRNVSCDHCGIAAAHYNVMAIFDDFENAQKKVVCNE